jgi:transcriptional regulator with XRE-family HTH domain
MSKDAKELILRQRIAANMAHYRKLHNMTQSELAEHISYSDKSVSKWERAEGVPDIYVLTLLAELFSVTVNDLLSENSTLPPPAINLNKNRVIVLLLSIGLVWLVATVTYTALRIFAPLLTWAWYAFIIAIPASCIVLVVLTSLWWGLWVRFLSVSALTWALAASVYILLPLTNLGLIFAVVGVLQVLIILWFLFQKYQKQLKKIEKDFLSRYEKKPKP